MEKGRALALVALVVAFSLVALVTLSLGSASQSTLPLARSRRKGDRKLRASSDD